MIHEIYPHIYHPEYRDIKPDSSSYLLYYEKGSILLGDNTGDSPIIPKYSDIESYDRDIYEKSYYLFSIDNDSFFLLHSISVNDINGYHLMPLTTIRSCTNNTHLAYAAITGGQIYRWRKNTCFCGKCGNATTPSHTERAVFCPQCGNTIYPRISPAIIVAVHDDNRLLLTKYNGGNYQNYALVAGFVEVGETLEEAVRREVMEEVGIHVKKIRPYKSQPWPYSDTMMFGFTAEPDGDDTIKVDHNELSEASWFNREDIPLPPFKQSIGHEMINAFRDGLL